MALRHWLQQHLPHTPSGASPLAGDLFLELAEAAAQGRRLDLDTLCREMAYPREALGEQLALMQQQGLLQVGADGRIEPTVGFQKLLLDYQQQLQAHFIPRRALRSTQLHLHIADARLSADVQALYDRCFDLGWLYLHRFGSTCFMLAMVVHAMLARRGYAVGLQIGHVEVRRSDKVYLLGRLRDPVPGRIEAHAWCVVEDRVVVDFGLGNVRRFHRASFPWAVGVDGRSGSPEQAVVTLPGGDCARWLTHGATATTDEVMQELRDCQLALPRLLAEHDQRFGAV